MSSGIQLAAGRNLLCPRRSPLGIAPFQLQPLILPLPHMDKDLSRFGSYSAEFLHILASACRGMLVLCEMGVRRFEREPNAMATNGYKSPNEPWVVRTIRALR